MKIPVFIIVYLKEIYIRRQKLFIIIIIIIMHE
jgi:hypothetical protein